MEDMIMIQVSVKIRGGGQCLQGQLRLLPSVKLYPYPAEE